MTDEEIVVYIVTYLDVTAIPYLPQWPCWNAMSAAKSNFVLTTCQHCHQGFVLVQIACLLLVSHSSQQRWIEKAFLLILFANLARLIIFGVSLLYCCVASDEWRK